MALNDTTYAFTGPDGTRAVVNDPADPDFVGYLNADNGIVGLLDGPDERENVGDLVAGDGGWQGPNYAGRLAGTINGFFDPAASRAQVVALKRKLWRATAGRRADVQMVWTPPDVGYACRLLLRRNQKPVESDRWPKRFQIALTQADHRITSSGEQQLLIVPGAAGGELGFASPISDPLSTTYGVAGSSIALNSGDVPAAWRATLTGPIVNPVMLNNTTGEFVRLLWSLAAAETLDVSTYGTYPTILLGGTSDVYRAYDFAGGSVWWSLDPAENDIRLLCTSWSPGAQLSFRWRHAHSCA